MPPDTIVHLKNKTFSIHGLVSTAQSRLHPTGLITAFGDEYLCASNAAYRAARVRALAHGFTFSGEPSQLTRDYQTCGLLSLQDILTQRTIPFLENAPFFDRLLVTHGDLTFRASFLLTNVHRNHLLHETAHAIASTVFTSSIRDAASDVESFRLDSQAAEAFANAVETFALRFARDDDHHALLLCANSYIGWGHTIIESMTRLAGAIGNEAVLGLLFVSFVRLNAGVRNDGDDEVRTCAEWAGVTPGTQQETEDVGHVARFSQYMNMAFLNDTSEMYFRFCGAALDSGSGPRKDESRVRDRVNLGLRHLIPQFIAEIECSGQNSVHLA